MTGYTDWIGGEEYNRDLSQRRADAVVAYLRAAGIGADRLSSVGKGLKDTIGDNRTPEGRAQNRRVVFRRIP